VILCAFGDRYLRYADPVLETVRADLLRFCEPGRPFQEATWSWPGVLRAGLSAQGAWAVLEYRFRRWSRDLPWPLALPFTGLGFLSRKVIETVTGISLPSAAIFGPGLYIGHFGEIIVGARVAAGANCSLSQGVTLGEDAGGSPTLGEAVFVGPGAKVLGGIQIGDRVVVGANAVVMRDVPSNATAVGVPARVLLDRPNLRDRSRS
jgi:serine O-acetyltransferase